MRSFYTLSIWILLGTFAGYGLLTLLGLGDKNEYSSRAFNFEKSASSVVNIWSLRRWREWQEKTPSLGLRRWKQVIKTGFFPDGSGVIFDDDGHVITNLHVLNNSIKLKQKQCCPRWLTVISCLYNLQLIFINPVYLYVFISYHYPSSPPQGILL